MQIKKNVFTGRILCIFCAAFVAGIALCAFFSVSFTIMVVTLAAFLFAATVKKLPGLFIVFTVCIFIFAGFAHFHYTKLADKNFSDHFSGRHLTISGKVTDISYTEDGRQGLVISVKSFNCLGEDYDKNFLTILYTDKEKTFDIGDNITFSDIFSPIKKNSVHSYDYELYLHTKNISTLFNLDSEYIDILDNSLNFSDRIKIFSKNIADKIRTLIGNEEGEVATAITLGDKTGFSDKLKTIFAKSGISHIVAVSGMHMSILIGFLFLILSKSRIHYKLRNIITTICVLGYMTLTGFSPSVTRAGIMAIFMLVSAIIDSKYDPLTALFFSAALILVFNPYSICSASFLLSFLAFLGILVFATPVKNKITARFIPDFIKHILSSSIAATIFTLPAIILIFGSVSTYSLLANLLIIPFVSIIFVAVIISLVLSLFFYPAGMILGFVAKILIKTLITVASGISRLPYSYINIKTPSFFDLICYAIIIILLYLALNGRRTGFTGHLILSAIACYFVICCTISALTYSVTFLDVGQGDSALVKSPGNHYFLIDTGPNGDVTMTALKSAGVNKLDIIFISHCDNDHSGALSDILENIPVKKVVLPNYNINSDEMANLVSLSLKNGANVDFASRYYSYNLAGISANALWPDCANYYVSGENDNSLVLSLDLKGTRFLFTGDIGNISEETILRTGQIINSDILKVAHHGSNDSGLSEFLEAVSADYSVISVGKYNTYGHPHEDLLMRLEDSGTTVLRTDLMGDIKFNADLFGNVRVSYGG